MLLSDLSWLPSSYGRGNPSGENKMLRRIAKLHSDQAGNESMQTVMIMAVGALIMIGVHALFKSDIGGEVQKHVKSVLSNGFTFGGK
jgi:hypothetical protein